MGSQSDLRNKYLTLFLETECSWCDKFYTNEPFECPYKMFQSSCFSINRKIEIIGWWTRVEAIKQYEQRIIEMMQQCEQKGIMTRCRKCGALNPNPQVKTCWNCKKMISIALFINL